MYKMMSFFLNDVFKHIDKAGSLPVRSNDKRGDVIAVALAVLRKEDKE